MKQILKLVFLLVLSQVTYGQAPSNYTNINGRYRWIAGMFDSTFHIPKGTTPSLRTGGSTNAGALFYRTSDSTVRYWTGSQWLTLSDTTRFVPYVGAIKDVDLNSWSLNAKSLHIKGTSGQGHLGLKFQSATPSMSANESGVYADASGNLGVKIDNLYTSIFKTSLNSADRTYTFQNKSYTVGDSADIAAKIGGTLVSGYLTKATGTNTIDTSQIYQSSGLIGIGTTTPAFKLDVNGDGSFNGVRIGRGGGNQSTNTSLGSLALRDNTTGNNNTAIGYWSLIFNTTGLQNTAVGMNSLYGNFTGGDNVAVGESAGAFIGTSGVVKNTSGTSSIFIGSQTRASADAQTNQIAIGYGVTGNGSNSVTLGNASITKTVLRENVGIGTVSPDSALTVVNGAYFQRGVRMSGLPTSPGTKALRINASGTISIADTLIDAGGTVTSVATNTGTGITGGTITTTGTIAADTLLLSTRLWRQKGVDSVIGVLGSRVSGTTNYIPKFTSSSAIGNSVMYESAGNINIGGDLYVIKSSAAAYNNLIIENGSSTGYVRTLYQVGSGGANGIAGISYAPSLFFKFGPQVNDSNTPITFVTNNDTERLRISSTGNVGIGTSSPSSLLHLSASTPILTITGSGSGEFGLKILDASASLGGLTYFSTTGEQRLNGAQSYIYQTFYSGGSERLRISSTGNVSIGNTNNTYKLDVSGTGRFDGNVQLTNDNYIYGNTTLGSATIRAGIRFNSTSQELKFFTADAGRMTLDASGNLGLGVTPSAWNSTWRAIQLPGGSIYSNAGGTTGQISIGQNWYYDGSQNRYINSAAASDYYQYAGEHRWFTAPSGTAGNAISFTQAMTLDASGRLGIGTTAPAYKLDITGQGRFTQGLISEQAININRTKSGTGVESLNVIDARIFGTNAIGDAINIAFINNGGNNIANISGILGGDNVAYGSLAFSTRNYFTDNMVEVMRINNRGNVGIGTTSPAYKLEVAAGSMGLTNTAGNNAYFEIAGNGNTLGSTSVILGQDAGSVGYLWNRANNALSFGTNNTERMRLNLSGELLINTTSDAGDYKLQVNGNIYANGVIRSDNAYMQIVNSSNPSLYLSNNTIQWQIYNNSSNELVFKDGSYDLFKLTYSNGNGTFGGSIKTAAPSGGTAKPYKLGEAGVAIGGSDGYAVKVEIDGTLYYLMTGYLPEPAPEATSGPSMGYKAKFEEPVIKIKTESQEIKELKKQIEELKQLIKNK